MSVAHAWVEPLQQCWRSSGGAFRGRHHRSVGGRPAPCRNGLDSIDQLRMIAVVDLDPIQVELKSVGGCQLEDVRSGLKHLPRNSYSLPESDSRSLVCGLRSRPRREPDQDNQESRNDSNTFTNVYVSPSSGSSRRRIYPSISWMPIPPVSDSSCVRFSSVRNTEHAFSKFLNTQISERIFKVLCY